MRKSDRIGSCQTYEGMDSRPISSIDPITLPIDFDFVGVWMMMDDSVCTCTGTLCRLLLSSNRYHCASSTVPAASDDRLLKVL